MQLGICSAILPDLNLREVLEFSATAGLDCVEVMCWPVGRAERRYAGVTHLDVNLVTPSSKSELESLVSDTGVAISALGYYPNALSHDEAEATMSAAHIVRVIEAAAELGLSRMNTFIGRNQFESVDANWPRMLRVWEPIVRRAEALQIKIGIENCPMIFTKDEWPGGKNLCTTPPIWRRLFTDLASDYLGLNFDPSHFAWQQIDYTAPLKEFASKLFHVHAKDARVDRAALAEVGIMAEPLKFHTPKIPGLGDINWGHFLSVLSDAPYHGPVCIEVEDRAFEHSLEARKASVVQSANYLRQFLPRNH